MEDVSTGGDLTEVAASLAAALGIGRSNSLPIRADDAKPLTLHEVRLFVASHVERLLQSKPEHLMSILYRIDVPERRVRLIFENAAYENLPMQLADLMVERQLQKIRTRRRYRNEDF